MEFHTKIIHRQNLTSIYISLMEFYNDKYEVDGILQKNNSSMKFHIKKYFNNEIMSSLSFEFQLSLMFLTQIITRIKIALIFIFFNV